MSLGISGYLENSPPINPIIPSKILLLSCSSLFCFISYWQSVPSLVVLDLLSTYLIFGSFCGSIQELLKTKSSFSSEKGLFICEHFESI